MKKLSLLLVAMVMCGALYSAADKALEAVAPDTQKSDATLCFAGLQPWVIEAKRLAEKASEGLKYAVGGVIVVSGETWESAPTLRDMLPRQQDPFKQLEDDPAFGTLNNLK